MLTGNEKCSNCKQVPYPRGFDPTAGLCWFCIFPGVGVKLSDAQRALVEASWEARDEAVA